MIESFLVTPKLNLTRIIFLALALSACGSNTAQPTAHTLTIFAASSLTEAFTEIGRAFEAQHPDTKVVFNFAGSQTLRTQIEQGASADVFASASQKEMDTLIANGLADQGDIFATNALIVIVPANNPGNVQTLQDLAKPGLKIVLAAEGVPVGKYARQSLELMNASFGADFSAKVLANVVSNEDNVKQVVAKVELGEADAGIVYVTDAQGDVKQIEIPKEINVIAQYPIAALNGAKELELARDFVAFVSSAEGQAILAQAGFGIDR